MTIPTAIGLAIGVSLATLVIVYFISNLTSSEKKIEYQIKADYGVADPQFFRSVGSLLGPALVPGNRIEILANGDQIFPAMLEAIRDARCSVCFETFIYWQGDIGEAFAEAFIERARAGVAVHVLVDWLGANKIDSAYIERMEAAGVEVERFHPLRWYNLDRVNNRTHRKVLVVDGLVGFIGGVGIADAWTGNAQDPEHWRDLHFRIRGPSVAQMQSAFMDNWVKIKSKVLHTARYFPELQCEGECHAQTFKSSPREGSESMRLMFLLSIACARQSIVIGNAYFVPDTLLVSALVAARQRGVAVRVIVPGKHIDTTLVRKASRSRWGKLLEAGVEIYEFQPTMYHTKLLVIDQFWTSVGSANFDNRSFRLNDEANLNIWNASFAASVSEEFDKDLLRSTQVTLADWKNRPMAEKAVEHLAGLFRGQM